jgi:hypothetical protein
LKVECSYPTIPTDNVEIDAPSNALKLNLDLAYLNGVAQDGHVDFIQFRNNLDVNINKQALVLLYRYVAVPPCHFTESLVLRYVLMALFFFPYRPGQYDILVRGSV